MKYTPATYVFERGDIVACEDVDEVIVRVSGGDREWPWRSTTGRSFSDMQIEAALGRNWFYVGNRVELSLKS